MTDETTITIKHVDTKLDDEVNIISSKDNKVSKNYYWLMILDLGLKAIKKGYNFDDDIPIKKR